MRYVNCLIFSYVGAECSFLCRIFLKKLTYPGAQAPHGMVQLSPDNGLPGWDRIAGYFYPDSTIAGFSHTHLSGTGAGDLYDISFMPAVEPLSIAEAPLGLHSKFSHEREEAWAGYYRVHLDDYNIDVELTATPRCGIRRYTYINKQDSAMVVLNLSKATNWDRTLDWHVEQRDSVTLVGYRFSDGWARLDSLFSYKPAEGEELPIFSTGMIGQYVHGNEPCHHVAYLYNYTGEPQKTQQYSKIIHFCSEPKPLLHSLLYPSLLQEYLFLTLMLFW